MEFLIGILIVSLFIGLLVRSKGDNTMDTLSKGCFYLFILVFLLIVYFLWYYPKEAMTV